MGLLFAILLQRVIKPRCFMSIKVKAVERELQVGSSAGQYRFIMQADLYGRLSESKVIQEAALRSGISKGAINAAWEAIGEVIKAWATEGHSVALPGLGTMRFGVRAKSVANVNEVATGLISSRRVIFTPNSDIKKELAATSINITCYDRNGNMVKRVTSDDGGTIEDPEDDNQPTDPDGGSSDTAGGNDHGGGGNGSGEAEQVFIGTSVNDQAMGSVTGMGTYDKGTTVTLTATANEGYRFVRWSDDVTDNPRTVTADVNGAAYTAVFESI